AVAPSKAVLLNLSGDHLLDALDVADLLAFEIPPQLLQVRLAVGVGDVLIVAPQSVEPLAQLVDQVVIVIGAAATFADVFQFLFGCQCHDETPFGVKGLFANTVDKRTSYMPNMKHKNVPMSPVTRLPCPNLRIVGDSYRLAL